MPDQPAILANQAKENLEFYDGARQLRLFGGLSIILLTIETVVNAAHAFFIFRMYAAAVAKDPAALQHAYSSWVFLIGYERYDYVLVVIAMAAFFTAIYGVRKAITSLGQNDWKYRYIWTVVALVIPLWNLYWPWLGLGEIDRNTSNAANVASLREDRGTKSFSRATFALAVVLIVSGVVVRLTTEAIDYMPAATTLDEAFDLSLSLKIMATLKAVTFGAVTLTIAFYLRRQMINLGKVKRAFNIA